MPLPHPVASHAGITLSLEPDTVMIRHNHRSRLRAFIVTFVCLIGISIAAPARAASIVVEPDSYIGFIPLAVFGIGPQTVAAVGVLNFTLPGMVFAGQTFTQVTMAENGYAVLGSHETSGAGTNQSLPNAASPNAILAPFWTDLTGGQLRVATLTDGVDEWFVMDWAGMTMAGGATTNFQVWIGLNGVEDITFAYDPAKMPSLPTSGLLTIGAEDPTGLFGMNYFYNGTGTLPTGDLRVKSDGLPMAPVPEPATMTLLGAGLAMSAIARRRAARRS